VLGATGLLRDRLADRELGPLVEVKLAAAASAGGAVVSPRKRATPKY
jgi:hypothetical protein